MPPLSEQQYKEQLLRAARRAQEAEQELMRAIFSARDAGLSIRKIARAAGTNATRIQRLLVREAARGPRKP